jgi:restriction endonuclease
MALSLKETRAVDELAEFLCSWLPGSGSRQWKGHVSFRSVAKKIGVDDFWQEGSKLPMLRTLLGRTLEARRALFEPLILEIVREGIIYRRKGGNATTADEIDTLNGLLLEIGFKFPDLWDAAFQQSLRVDVTRTARAKVDILKEQHQAAAAQSQVSSDLRVLKDQFLSLHNETNRSKAGKALETILNRLFALHGLAPREPFRVVGEEIDGSFDLDHETYLLEAKWEKNPLPEADLLVFRGKIEGKSAYTRGLFVAIEGISDQAKVAVSHGKQPTFFIVDGYDILMILSEAISLIDFLRKRRRLLAERGLVSVSFREI